VAGDAAITGTPAVMAGDRPAVAATSRVDPEKFLIYT
jgi:hypothetical protein